MLISVIVPNYNHAEYLGKRIDTILEQSYQNFEVIILDDCSTDDSRNIIEKYKNHKKISQIIYNETNSGSTFKQWNKGVSVAKGELIWLAESDDFAGPDLLESLKAEFDADPELGIVYCQSNKVNEKNEITGDWHFWTDDLDAELFKKRFKMQGKDYVEKFLLYRNTIPNASAVLFKKKYYQFVGGADEKVLKCSDWMTWIKILLISDIAYIPRHLNNYRYHDNSVIAAAKKDAVNYFLGRYQIFMRKSLNTFLKKKTLKQKDLINIRKKNYDLLQRERVEEGVFYLNNKSWIKGTGIIIKTSLRSTKTFLFVLKIILDKSFNTIKGFKKVVIQSL